VRGRTCPRPPSTTGSRTCRWAASAASLRRTALEPCRRSTAGCERRPTSRARPSTTSYLACRRSANFVVLYIVEGYKRNRTLVSIGNSDPRMVEMATGWLRRLPSRRLCYAVQYHADQDLKRLRAFWGSRLEIDGSHIRLQRKSNSGQLRGRMWRSEHGGSHGVRQRHRAAIETSGVDRSRPR
jgi:hypothetical protein